MAVLKSALRDNLVVGAIILMLMLMSFTSINTMRLQQRNSETLRLVQECVLPAGTLCKGDPDATQQLLASLVKQINDHTDAVVGHH